MGFTTYVDEKDYGIISLRDENNHTVAEIYSFGALLNGFRARTFSGDINIIDGYSSPADAREHITKAFKSAKLSPFVCRMQKGEYSYNDASYKIQKFYLGDEAIHGLVFNFPFSIMRCGSNEQSAFVCLRCDYSNVNEGYPFPFTMEVTYTLHPDSLLTVETAVKNTGTSSMPLNDGWHPYFTFGCPVDDLQVYFNTETMLEFDNRLLPTGAYVPYDKFRSTKIFGETALDNCFVLRDFSSPACTLTDMHSRVRLTIRAITGYPYLQVYTPPHRRSIAIENLSSAPDSFNNHIGLIIVKPGEEATFATSYQLQTL